MLGFKFLQGPYSCTSGFVSTVTSKSRAWFSVYSYTAQRTLRDVFGGEEWEGEWREERGQQKGSYESWVYLGLRVYPEPSKPCLVP